MQVTVRLFAGLRELAGTGRSELELREGATVADVWPALGLGDEPSGLLYAVNRAYAEPERRLVEGDEVALIPPVSGGAFSLAKAGADLAEVIAEVADERDHLAPRECGRRVGRGPEKGPDASGPFSS